MKALSIIFIALLYGLASNEASAGPGDLDLSFNGTGKVVTRFGSGSDAANSTAVQSDGKIVAAGYFTNVGKVCFALARYNTNGSLDTSFNGTGMVTTSIGSANDKAYSVAVQVDGKIVAAGYSYNGSKWDFAVVRYNANGSLDTNFNGTGKASTSIGNVEDQARGVAVQGDGKIVVAGYSYNGSNHDFAVVRYNANGSLDTSFNGTGKLTTPIGVSHDYCYSVALQGDGKIVAAGSSVVAGNVDFAVVRYNANGGLDASFGGAGIVTTAIGSSTDSANSVAVQGDGKIVAAGFSDRSTRDFALVRYNANGSLDTSFNGSGKLTTAIGNSDEASQDVAILSDGKIIAAGYSYAGNSNVFAMARYNANGSLDASFSGTGLVTTVISGSSTAWSVAVQGDGRIVAAGVSAASTSSDGDFAVVRYDGDLSEVVIEQPAGTNLTDGDAIVDFTGVILGNNSPLTFIIRNTGTAPLTGLAVSKDGSHAGDFAVSSVGGATVAPGASQSVTVTFTPTAAGIRNAVIHVTSNDEDENPFDINVTGTGLAPEIVVEEPSGTSLADGVASINFDSVILGQSWPLTFTIRNTGTAPLTGLSVSKAGANAGDFLMEPLGLTSLAPNVSTTLAVTFAPSVLGTRIATIHITSNDLDENPFDISLAGTGISPEIVLEQPAGTSLVDGTATTNFGSVNLGGIASLSFTIRNTGTASLTGLAAATDGSHAGDFIVAPFGVTALAPGASGIFTATFSPTGTGARSAVIHIASNDADENPFDINVTGLGTVPEIAVEQPAGSGLTDGASPSNFGNVYLGFGAPLGFTIRNSGTGPLGGLVISKDGSHAGDFIVNGPSVITLAPGASTAFTVTFTPTAGGMRSAAIHIASDDADENPFDLNLSGMGLVSEIAVEQPVGTSLMDAGSAVNLGSSNVGTGAPITFTIRNTGPDPLGGLSITKDGSHAGDFSVSSLGITTLAPGASSTFSVTFSPSATGARTAAVHIGSNDADENPFDISLIGTGTTPEIVVEQPAGTNLVDGTATRNFGSVYLGLGVPLVFTIRNTGTGPLGGLMVSKDGSHAGDFTVDGPGVTALAPSASTTFTVTFTPTAGGARSATIHIGSDDADENPFDINLTGTGLVSEIVVEQPVGTGLTDGTALADFGSVNVGGNAPLTFTIRNTGTDPLTGLAATKDGSNAGDFSVSSLSNANLAAEASRTFTVTFIPTAAGTRSAAIHIASNDADENPFDINLTGIGAVPEIAVEQPAGTDLVDGTATVIFGTVNLGKSAAQTFTVRNTGSGPLTGLAISKNGSNAADFTVGSLGVTTLAAGASKAFTVTFNPAAIGTRTAAIHIASNDADENPFDINLAGVGNPVSEIVVEQPAGTGLTDASATPVNFGSVATGTSVSRIFTIRNTGTADLTGIAATLSGGTAAGDFSVWDLGATQLAPGAATTLTVFFAPAGSGARTTTLLIASNDEDENPFEIALTGTRATPELDAWRQTYFGSTANSGAGADLSDPDRDGVLNLMEFATGSGPWVPNGQPGELVKAGSSLEFTWPRRKAALGEVTYEVEWSESLTSPWSAAGVSTALLTDGSVMQQMKTTLPAGAGGRRFVRLRVTRR